MGVVIGKVFPKDKDPETPEFIVPTKAQIDIIKETWEIPKAHLTDTGEYILFRFLDDFPKNQNQFEAFSNVPLLSLKGTPGFRTHAGRMQEVIQTAIDCLDTEDVALNLRKTFLPMGISHARRSTPKISFFELRGIILDVLTDACNLNEEQREAWTVFFNCAINLIFNDFDQYNAQMEIEKHKRRNKY